MPSNPLPGQVMMAIEGIDEYANQNGAADEPRRVTSVAAEATVVTSLVDSKLGQGVHKPVLDIDMPVKVIESSTPGHHHLFIDKELTSKQYFKLLDVLVECGIIEFGYKYHSERRGFTAIRVPWVRKGTVHDTCTGYSSVT